MLGVSSPGVGLFKILAMVAILSWTSLKTVVISSVCPWSFLVYGKMRHADEHYRERVLVVCSWSGLEDLSGFILMGFPRSVEDMKDHFLVSCVFYFSHSLVKIEAMWSHSYWPCNRSDVGHDNRKVVRASSFPVNES